MRTDIRCSCIKILWYLDPKKRFPDRQAMILQGLANGRPRGWPQVSRLSAPHQHPQHDLPEPEILQSDFWFVPGRPMVPVPPGSLRRTTGIHDFSLAAVKVGPYLLRKSRPLPLTVLSCFLLPMPDACTHKKCLK